MRVGIATDHGGSGLKEDLVAHIRAAGHEVVDFGAHQRQLLGKELTLISVPPRGRSSRGTCRQT